MKYMLMMMGTKADCEAYTKWSKEDLAASFGFMRGFSKKLKDSGAFVATEGLAFPDQAKIVRAGSDVILRLLGQDWLLIQCAVAI